MIVCEVSKAAARWGEKSHWVGQRGGGRWPWPSTLGEGGGSRVGAVCGDGSSRCFGVSESGDPGRVWSVGNGRKSDDSGGGKPGPG